MSLFKRSVVSEITSHAGVVFSTLLIVWLLSLIHISNWCARKSSAWWAMNCPTAVSYTHLYVYKRQEELRTAIVLREIEGMSYEDIAQSMDCPIGTVRSRIFRAREAIATKLRPLLGTDAGRRW